MLYLVKHKSTLYQSSDGQDPMEEPRVGCLAGGLVKWGIAVALRSLASQLNRTKSD